MHADVAVVGAGPGGYVAAIRAAQRGLDVALVERDAYGGVCLNAGCIPSKALVSAADLAHRAATAGEMGIHADPTVDFAALADWKDDVVGNMTDAVRKLCRANGVALVEGEAAFVDERTLRVETADGTETLGFDRAVVATGSRPVALPGLPFDGERVLTSAALLDRRTRPDRLVVVGAGYVGMELATALAKLGTDVAVLEALDTPLPGYGADLVRPVRRRAEELGVDFHFGHAATGRRETDGGVAVVAAADGETREVAGDAALVAVGRQPVTDTVDPGAAGLAPDDDGFLPTDATGETPVEGIYAVGDVAGEPMLAHAASHEGKVAAAAIAGDDPDPAGPVPAAAFTDPELGTVGLTPEGARDAGHEPAVGEFPFRASGRALAANEPTGFARVVAAADGTVLGGQVVGPHASELVAEIGVAVRTGAPLAALATTVHAHPTLAEAVAEAAENARGEAIHTLNR